MTFLTNSLDSQPGCHFSPWWCLVRSPFLVCPFLCIISLAVSSHRLQSFLWCETFFGYLTWFEILGLNTQKLREFGLITAFSTLPVQKWGRVEGLLTAAWGRINRSSCRSDQLLSFSQCKGTRKVLKSLPQTSSLLPIVFDQVNFWPAHGCEPKSGGLQSGG